MRHASHQRPFKYLVYARRLSPTKHSETRNLVYIGQTSNRQLSCYLVYSFDRSKEKLSIQYPENSGSKVILESNKDVVEGYTVGAR